MLPKINIEMNSVQLFEAQAAIGAKLKGFEEFSKLTERDQELILEYLREYSVMLQSYVMNKHYVKPQPVVTEAPKGRMHEELVKPSTAVADKSKVLADWEVNYEKAFGRKPKKTA